RSQVSVPTPPSARRLQMSGRAELVMRKGGQRSDANDIAVGRRVRARRLELGMTQPQVGELVGVSHQQIHKYEQGKNRISSSRLLGLAAALQCPVEFLLGSRFSTAADDSLAHTLLGMRSGVRVARSVISIGSPGIAEALAR